MRYILITLSYCIALGGVFAGDPKAPDTKALANFESGPLYLGSINSGFKVSEDYFDANLNLVAPVWSSLGTDGILGGGVLFLEPYVSWGENGEVATSLGLGYRYLFNDQPVSALRSPRDDQAGFWDEGLAIGANFFVDLLDTEADNRFWQLGFGLEVATRYIELRGNYYLPLSDRQLAERRVFNESRTSSRTTTRPVTQTSAPYDDGQGLLVQDQTTSLVATTTTTTTTIRHIFERYEEGMEGWDAEVALLVPGLDKYCDVKLIGGYFKLDNSPFGPQKGGTGNVEGWKAGLEIRPVPAVALTGMWYEDERFLGSDWMFGARMEIPFEMGDLGDGKGMWGRIRDAFTPRRRHLVERMAEPVHRQNAAIHIANTQKEESKVAKVSSSTSTQVISQTKNKIVLGLGPSATNFDQVTGGTLQLGTISFANGYPYWQTTNIDGTLYTNKIGNSLFLPSGGGTVMVLPAGSISSGLGAPIKFTPYSNYTGYWSGGGSIIVSTINYSSHTSDSLTFAGYAGSSTVALGRSLTLYDTRGAGGTALILPVNGSFAWDATRFLSGGELTAAPVNTTFGLTKAGAGTLTLSGTNTYTGATIISAGTLAVGGANGASLSLHTSGIVLSGGNLLVNGPVNLGSSITSSSPGSVTIGSVFTGTMQVPTSITGATSLILQRTLSIDGTSVSSGTYPITNGTINLSSGILQLSGATITTP